MEGYALLLTKLAKIATPLLQKKNKIKRVMAAPQNYFCTVYALHRTRCDVEGVGYEIVATCQKYPHVSVPVGSPVSSNPGSYFKLLLLLPRNNWSASNEGIGQGSVGSTMQAMQRKEKKH